MPSPLQRMRPTQLRRETLLPVNALLTVLFLLSAAVPLASAKVQSARLSVDVQPSQWKAVRLQNLPATASIKVEIRSSGTATVSLLDESQFQNYPEVQRPLFQGTVQDKLSFAVKIPADGAYLVVFDNKSKIRIITLDVVITGASGADAMVLDGNPPGDQEDALGKTLSAFGQELRKLFIFKPFPITAKTCGKETALSGPEGVVLCMEFVKKISDTMGSKEKTVNALLFTVFHEVAHNLLSQWGYPFADNEEVADDFATAIMMMLGQKERLSAMTEFFISNPTSKELLAKAFQGDRHPLSIQRARDILRWTKDPERIRRWQTVFVPHMQTEVLEKLNATRPAWADSALIEQELKIRTVLRHR
ncbi:MAG: DUF4344 domain-containing metallopeptidase [bacterium]